MNPRTGKSFIVLILLSVVFISGCVQEQPIGGQTDEHGCLPAAGYTWCESRRECLRTWEVDCPSEILTPEECEARGGRTLNIVGGDECYDNETTIAGVSGFISPNVCCQSKDNACTASGGSVSTTSCCLSSDDFPNSCNIGACGCAPTSSHDVKTCDCGEGKCFNGDECITNVIDFDTSSAPVIG